MNSREDGVELLSGVCTVNNSDVDAYGNTIHTVTISVDLRNTDTYELGDYYITINTVLATGQTDFFRVPVELIDYRTAGVS